MSTKTVNRNLLRNINSFTSLRRKLHEVERECEELLDFPFHNDLEKSTVENVYQQVLFCLEITRS